MDEQNEALQQATINMARWLERDHKLNPSEVASMLGTAARPQRQAYTDLGDALRHAARHHAVDADQPEQQRERRENAEQHGVEAQARERAFRS
jgi:hypothetical protein